MEQRPIASAFGSRTSAREVLEGIDLSGKRAIVTGGYSGLGLAVTRALQEAGATVIVPARRRGPAEQALSGLARVTVEDIDLANLDSVRHFAARVLADDKPVDLLICNAGVMACPETHVGRNWELQFAVNHLGHFVLTCSLWPALEKAAPGARVVSVRSGAHAISGIRWDDPNFETGYDPWQAYGQSKTANALFAVQLEAIGAPFDIHAFAVHPGNILTPLQRHLDKSEMVAAGWIDDQGNLVDPSFKTPEQGAATIVWAATSTELRGKGGVYCEDCNVAPIATRPDEPGVRPHAIDPANARRLWELSVAMTGSDIADEANPAGR